VAYRMVSLPMSLNDLEGGYCWLKPTAREMQSAFIIYDMFTHK